ncbi:MAG TPA: AbrB family transcriptional regulator, partial [Microvirga sp.]|nr:AbrB family transcriptional regulator [Microvirga sp.]
MPPVLAHLVQFGVAALGGFAFHRLGIPAAWLSGSMIAAVLWRASGQGRPLPKPLLDFAMLISGTAMGAGVTSESLAAVARYPLSLASLALGLVAISGASMLWLTRASGWRRDDAVLASVPGALSTVLIVAAERKADVGSIAIVQMFRLLVLMAVLPSIVVLAGGAQGEAWLGARQAIATPLGLAANLVGGLAAGALFRRIGIAAPILFGTAAVSAALHVTDLTPGVVPPAIATVSLVLIGMFIAENFRHLKWSAVRRLVPAALGSFVLGMAVASFFAAVGAKLARVGFADALVAFAPGGLEAMMVLALVLGLDPLYVGVHHLVRLIVLGFSI